MVTQSLLLALVWARFALSRLTDTSILDFSSVRNALLDLRSDVCLQDGISTPRLQGFNEKNADGQDVISAGQIVTGHSDVIKAQPPAYGRDGSFLVIRDLRQLVPECTLHYLQTYMELKYRSVHAQSEANATDKISAEKIRARMIGRWPSGVSLDKVADADPGKDSPFTKFQDFDFAGDLKGSQCT